MVPVLYVIVAELLILFITDPRTPRIMNTLAKKSPSFWHILIALFILYFIFHSRCFGVNACDSVATIAFCSSLWCMPLLAVLICVLAGIQIISHKSLRYLYRGAVCGWLLSLGIVVWQGYELIYKSSGDLLDFPMLVTAGLFLTIAPPCWFMLEYNSYYYGLITDPKIWNVPGEFSDNGFRDADGQDLLKRLLAELKDDQDRASKVWLAIGATLVLFIQIHKELSGGAARHHLERPADIKIGVFIDGRK